MASRTDPIRTLDLCAGLAGFSLGLELALGHRQHTVCHVEREAYAAAALVARMEEQALDQAPVWDDLTTFDGTPWRGVVDLVTAGFPCQPWSIAGKKQGRADDRWIWDDIARIIDEVQPRYVLLENVPGLANGGLGPVCRSLAESGFDAEWDLFRASDAGAPHRRERLVIFGWHPERVAHARSIRERTGMEVERRDDAERRRARMAHPEAVADADLEGREGPEPAQRRDLLARTGAWPLGPDQPGWQDLPACTQPGVRGVADGTPPWMEFRSDRLRACGNGVVPAVVAYALRVLAGRCGFEIGEL